MRTILCHKVNQHTDHQLNPIDLAGSNSHYCSYIQLDSTELGDLYGDEGLYQKQYHTIQITDISVYLYTQLPVKYQHVYAQHVLFGSNEVYRQVVIQLEPLHQLIRQVVSNEKYHQRPEHRYMKSVIDFVSHYHLILHQLFKNNQLKLFVDHAVYRYEQIKSMCQQAQQINFPVLTISPRQTAPDSFIDRIAVSGGINSMEKIDQLYNECRQSVVQMVTHQIRHLQQNISHTQQLSDRVPNERQLFELQQLVQQWQQE